MVETLNSYIQILLHPILTHKARSEERSRLQMMKKNRLFEVVREPTENDRTIDFTTIVLISWLFFMIYSLYSLAFANLGSVITADEETTGFISSLISSSEFQKKLFILTMIGNVVFFPLSAWIYVKLWRTLINFFLSIYDKNVEKDSVDEVVNYSLVSNFFLIIPVIGNFIKMLCSAYYIFLGLKHNIKLNSVQSFVVVLSPVILIGLLLLAMMLYVLLIINLIEFPILFN